MKRALILGITGQDGSYLAEFLLGKSYELHGVVRRASTFNTDRLDDIYADPHEPGVALRLHFGDSAAFALRFRAERSGWWFGEPEDRSESFYMWTIWPMQPFF